jgi:hypothetical protein
MLQVVSNDVTLCRKHMYHQTIEYYWCTVTLKFLNPFKNYAAICFGLCGHHQVLELLQCWTCCAHLVLFLVRSHV